MYCVWSEYDYHNDLDYEYDDDEREILVNAAIKEFNRDEERSKEAELEYKHMEAARKQLESLQKQAEEQKGHPQSTENMKSPTEYSGNELKDVRSTEKETARKDESDSPLKVDSDSKSASSESNGSVASDSATSTNDSAYSSEEQELELSEKCNGNIWQETKMEGTCERESTPSKKTEVTSGDDHSPVHIIDNATTPAHCSKTAAPNEILHNQLVKDGVKTRSMSRAKLLTDNCSHTGTIKMKFQRTITGEFQCQLLSPVDPGQGEKRKHSGFSHDERCSPVIKRSVLQDQEKEKKEQEFQGLKEKREEQDVVYGKCPVLKRITPLDLTVILEECDSNDDSEGPPEIECYLENLQKP